MLRTLSSEYVDIPLDDRPDDAIIHRGVLVSQLISEVDDSTRVADGTEDLI